MLLFWARQRSIWKMYTKTWTEAYKILTINFHSFCNWKDLSLIFYRVFVIMFNITYLKVGCERPVSLKNSLGLCNRSLWVYTVYKKRDLTEFLKNILQKSKSFQMCSKIQKKNKKIDETFKGFYRVSKWRIYYYRTIL